MKAKLTRPNGDVEFLDLNRKYLAADIVKTIGSYVGLRTWEEVLHEEQIVLNTMKTGWNTYSGISGTLTFYNSRKFQY